MAMLTLGCDPETFLFNPTTGKFVSAVDKIGGSKEYPMPIDDQGNAVQEDNVAVEFNTPPCQSAKDFIHHININKEWIKAKALEMGLEMSVKPSAVFDDEELRSRAARTFGCDPDYNAWLDGKMNPRPKAANKNLRSCGGHIHIQMEDDDNPLEIIKAMDLFVGCMMLEFDNDKDRRELYGKAGAFRKKSYGVEYRTASNAWIESDERIQWVWDQTEKAVAYARSGVGFTEAQGRMIQECINNSDTELLNQLKVEFNL